MCTSDLIAVYCASVQVSSKAMSPYKDTCPGWPSSGMGLMDLHTYINELGLWYSWYPTRTTMK